MRYVLLIVAVIMFWVGFGVIHQWERHTFGLRWTKYRLERTTNELYCIGYHLKAYNNETGRYPSNDEGLLAVKDLVANYDVPGEPWVTAPHDYRVGDSGILSLWGEPYIYENRRGLDADSFTGSGATRDTKRAYSVEVANGVYVWSLAAQQAHREYTAGRRIVAALMGLVGVICAVPVGLYIRSTLRLIGPGYTGWRRFRRVSWSLLGGGVITLLCSAVLFPLSLGATCYGFSVTRRRTPQLTRNYLSIMQNYHERGVISDSAYRKIVEAMKEEDSR